MIAFIASDYLVTVASDGLARTYQRTDRLEIELGTFAPAGAYAVGLASGRDARITLGEALWFALNDNPRNLTPELKAVQRFSRAEAMRQSAEAVREVLDRQQFAAEDAGEDVAEIGPLVISEFAEIDAEYRVAREAVEPLIEALRRQLPATAI